MTLLYFALVLGIVVFIHELGHFIFAKKAGIYIYEFAIGMGPRLFEFKRKNDETVYSIRLFPIGGFVQMAGESIEEDNNIPKSGMFQSKTWLQRFLTITAGIIFNFILAIILLFIIGLIYGAPKNKPYISYVDKTYPVYALGLVKGDQITKIDGLKISSVDHLLLEMQIRYSKTIVMTVKHHDGKISNLKIKPIATKNDGFKYGFTLDGTKTYGVISAIEYGFVKTFSLLHQMVLIIWYLITLKLGLGTLAGPIGIYTIVGDAAKAGFISVIYLISLISINVGFINLLPIPAFDGGRLLFLIIEKIKGKAVDPKIENTFHTIGFALLMILMLLITYNDIMRLFK